MKTVFTSQRIGQFITAASPSLVLGLMEGVLAVRKLFPAAFLACALIMLSLSARAMQPMGDAEMSDVSGREGVLLDVELRLNTDASGSPLNNANLTNCAGSGGAQNSDCRFALKAQGRDEWVLFRGVYGSINITGLKLDAGVLSGAGAPTGNFDATRFQDPGGNCLLPGGTCTAAALSEQPALKFEYLPGNTPSYDPGTGVSSGYDSLKVGFNIEETRLIFNDSNAGFTTDVNPGSFLGAKIRDNNSPRAGISISGRSYVYGF
jgi:hypothetical protein